MGPFINNANSYTSYHSRFVKWSIELSVKLTLFLELPFESRSAFHLSIAENVSFLKILRYAHFIRHVVEILCRTILVRSPSKGIYLSFLQLSIPCDVIDYYGTNGLFVIHSGHVSESFYSRNLQFLIFVSHSRVYQICTETSAL